MSAEPPLRVLLAAPETTGGIGQHVRMLAGGLIARGHRATVCAPASTLERLKLPAGVEPAAVGIGTTHDWRRTRRRLGVLAAAHDVTHAHGVRAGAQLALSGAQPLVVSWHNAPLGGLAHRAVHAALERMCARRSAVILGASEDLVARATAAGARSARFCPVAAAPRQQPRDRAESTARAAWTPGVGVVHQGEPSPGADHAPLVLAIARLHPQKRLDLLIDATAGWADDPHHPDVLVAGDGPLASRLRQRAHAQRAPVTFLGARDDVDALLAEADVVVLPSDWEARPLVAQEALRAGVPLIATDVGGVRGLVGDAAVLIPRGDAHALGDAIQCVLRDAELRQRLRAEGPAQAARWPTVEQMIDEIVSTYLDVR